MVQNVQHWLLDREQFPWARANVPETKWFQITKYFPGYKLRRQMMYLDAETGQPIPAEGGEIVPQGKVYLYGLDLRNFCGIEVPGLNDAITATRKSRVEQRSAHGDPAAGAAPAAGATGAAPAPTPSASSAPSASSSTPKES
jgi:hypothetical protein